MTTSASSAKTNVMAVISLIAGIVSWLMFPLVAAVVAIIAGHMARGQIKNSYGAETGDGLAVAGLVLGYLNLAMSCIGLLIALLFFGGMIGLTGCAILTESSSMLPGAGVIPPIP